MCLSIYLLHIPEQFALHFSKIALREIEIDHPNPFPPIGYLPFLMDLRIAERPLESIGTEYGSGVADLGLRGAPLIHLRDEILGHLVIPDPIERLPETQDHLILP